MPKPVSEVTVFVACPSDCDQFRPAIRAAINELNHSGTAGDGVRIRYTGFDTSVGPGMSSRAQEVVNEQIGDDYDIFLGLLSARYGTPTGIAGSGTEEEFNRAFERHQKNPRSVRIMFYNCVASVDPRSVDLEQLAKVRKFIDRLKSSGAVVHEFTDPQQLEQAIRMHLPRQARESVVENAAITGVEPFPAREEVQTSQSAPGDTSEEMAPLDAIVRSQDFMSFFNRGLESMSNYMEDLTNSITKHTGELLAAQQTNPNDMRRIKALVDSMAEELSLFGTRTTNELPVLSTHFRNAMDAAGQAIIGSEREGMMGDDGDIAALRIVLKGMKQRMEEAVAGIGSLRTQLDSVPRLTSRFGTARNQAVRALTSTATEFTALTGWIDQLLSTLRETPS